MPKIFEPTNINGMTLANRLVRSATWEGLADSEGGVTDALVALMEKLAQGGVGLVISSYMSVRADGRQLPGQLSADHDRLIPGLARLADAVHNAGGVVAGQIVHCGGQTDRRANGGLQPIAPSAFESKGYPEMPRELDSAEIDELVACFAKAAGRLKAAGFDGVQLHGAHGYLLSQFLSPLRNRRTDHFGGSLENRSRFTLEVFRAVRAEVGANFPVMIKINANDFLEGSTTEEDSIYLAAALAAAGIDCIEVSGGTPGSGRLGPVRDGIESAAQEAYFQPQATALRMAAGAVPLMLVGGLRSPAKIESLLAQGIADYFSLCRPLIREPGLPSRWRNGDLARAACMSCNGCFGIAQKGGGIRCVRENGASD